VNQMRHVDKGRDFYGEYVRGLEHLRKNKEN